MSYTLITNSFNNVGVYRSKKRRSIKIEDRASGKVLVRKRFNSLRELNVFLSQFDYNLADVSIQILNALQ